MKPTGLASGPSVIALSTPEIVLPRMVLELDAIPMPRQPGKSVTFFEKVPGAGKGVKPIWLCATVLPSAFDANVIAFEL